jgi:hypothetical protein
MKRTIALLLLMMMMSAYASAMTRSDAVEWLMDKGYPGTDGKVYVNIAYGIATMIGEDNTHSFNVCIEEVVRRMKFQTPEQIDLNEVVRVAREIIAYEDEVRFR